MKALSTIIFLLAALSVFGQNQPIFLNETFYSGFLSLPNNKGQIFYWLFESRNAPDTDPLIISLGGGPGCASEISVFTENGPYRMVDYENETVTLQTNPYSWNNVANVLYVDHPLGIGYSAGNSYEQNEAAIAQDAGAWLAEFLSIFPEYKGRDFYLAANSFAAHYVPVVYTNISTSPDLVPKGILMGSAWLDPASLYVSYAKFAFASGLINQLKFDTYATAFQACKALINSQNYGAAITACNATMHQFVGNPPNFNFYNINQTCNVTSTGCYDYTALTYFLGTPAPELILGVNQAQWAMCNQTVNVNLAQDRIRSVTGTLGSILNNGTQVLLYNGVFDLIANWMGGEYTATNMTWTGQQQFISAPYTVDGDFGEYKAYENLVFYKVYGAGHLVATDQPEASLNLLLKFISGWKSEHSFKSEEIIM